ncbi:MAG: hypothetical protein LBS36_04290 [Oscillospiraceae bacterium]|nr:hypothetical protein [Oscillospiraceae bacterium]
MFKYNQAGLRTKKIAGETMTEYTYAGGLLMSQSDGVNTLNYVYSVGGTMLGVQYNDVNYYYLRNLQGDVTGIYDSNGDVVANYLYDTWGLMERSRAARKIDSIRLKNNAILIIYSEI